MNTDIIKLLVNALELTKDIAEAVYEEFEEDFNSCLDEQDVESLVEELSRVLSSPADKTPIMTLEVKYDRYEFSRED